MENLEPNPNKSRQTNFQIYLQWRFYTLSLIKPGQLKISNLGLLSKFYPASVRKARSCCNDVPATTRQSCQNKKVTFLGGRPMFFLGLTPLAMWVIFIPCICVGLRPKLRYILSPGRYNRVESGGCIAGGKYKWRNACARRWRPVLKIQNWKCKADWIRPNKPKVESGHKFAFRLE